MLIYVLQYTHTHTYTHTLSPPLLHLLSHNGLKIELESYPKDARVFRVPPCCAFTLRDAFQDVYGHQVLINS